MPATPNRSRSQTGPLTRYSANQTATPPRRWPPGGRRGSEARPRTRSSDGLARRQQGEPVTQLAQPTRPDLVLDPAARSTTDDQPGLAQDPQVVGEEVLGHAQPRP